MQKAQTHTIMSIIHRGMPTMQFNTKYEYGRSCISFQSGSTHLYFWDKRQQQQKDHCTVIHHHTRLCSYTSHVGLDHRAEWCVLAVSAIIMYGLIIESVDIHGNKVSSHTAMRRFISNLGCKQPSGYYCIAHGLSIVLSIHPSIHPSKTIFWCGR